MTGSKPNNTCGDYDDNNYDDDDDDDDDDDGDDNDDDGCDNFDDDFEWTQIESLDTKKEWKYLRCGDNEKKIVVELTCLKLACLSWVSMHCYNIA